MALPKAGLRNVPRKVLEHTTGRRWGDSGKRTGSECLHPSEGIVFGDPVTGQAGPCRLLAAWTRAEGQARLRGRPHRASPLTLAADVALLLREALPKPCPRTLLSWPWSAGHEATSAARAASAPRPSRGPAVGMCF